MSQRILQPGEIEALDRTQLPRIILPQPDSLLRERASRLHQLAQDNHSVGPFLEYLKRLVDAQRAAVARMPVLPQPDEALIERAQRHAMPLWQLPDDIDPVWQQMLKEITAHLLTGPEAETLSDTERQVAEEVQAMDSTALTRMLARLWTDVVLDAEERVRAPLLMAAVQVVMMVRASQLNLKTLPIVEPPTVCPVCGSTPLASIVHVGGQVEGLRYLHCSVCETEWHMVRVKCSNCATTEGISYRQLEPAGEPAQTVEELKASPVAASRYFSACMAEVCSKCNSYSKVFDQRRDPMLEVMADDINTLVLDAAMGQFGHVRAGSHPFLFPVDDGDDAAILDPEAADGAPDGQPAGDASPLDDPALFAQEKHRPH